MSPEVVILAFATILGPVVAVGLSLWGQKRMQGMQSRANAEIMKSMEDERRKFEMERAEARAKWEKEWNRADLTRQDHIKNELQRMANALEKESWPAK